MGCSFAAVFEHLSYLGTILILAIQQVENLRPLFHFPVDGAIAQDFVFSYLHYLHHQSCVGWGSGGGIAVVVGVTTWVTEMMDVCTVSRLPGFQGTTIVVVVVCGGGICQAGTSWVCEPAALLTGSLWLLVLLPCCCLALLQLAEGAGPWAPTLLLRRCPSAWCGGRTPTPPLLLC